jgi:hypothetical protein
MTERRKPDGKISACHEVKGEALNLKCGAVGRNVQRFRHRWGLSWRIALRASALPCLGFYRLGAWSWAAWGLDPARRGRDTRGDSREGIST